MDAGDDIEEELEELVSGEALSDDDDNPDSVAGNTFLGQFLDHDLTLDFGSQLGRPTPVRRSVNLRTPRMDLDMVYGGGPQVSPELYADDGLHLRVESGGLFEDLPRLDDGTALIGDPRNDENVVIGGLHAAFLMFHNAVTDRLGPAAGFREVRREVRWHWQWVVVHELLPAFVGQPLVDDVVANGPRFFDDRGGRIPVEFQTAAYRFGHSLVRPAYLLNRTGNDGAPFAAAVFDPTQDESDDPDDLSGGHRAPRRFVDWHGFFDFGDERVQRPELIDTKLSSPLFALPADAIPSQRGERLGPTSLATRNLLRHLTWGIPSGQRVAQAMGETPLAAEDLADLQPFGNRLQASTPLWFYVLREADLTADGRRLGPVGGRIVAEVFLHLLRRDRASYLNGPAGWRPTLPVLDQAAGFRMVDLLTIAGVADR